ncbi:Carboxylic ester hydrolase [Pleurostoma richardsiae]|uniref:Carboxylic ester hydrolase n=1 Tax=Pleurostoma richardsiae TaxID=41990 RepID=A0AA38S4W9_9PEZI|nr:Carboxylic ester hydrolase [Pleurostoma richardsiae]
MKALNFRNALFSASALTSLLAAVTCQTFDQTCATIGESIAIPNATVWFSEYIAGGTNITFPDNDPSCTRPSQVVDVDICRIALQVDTSARSNISMEVWLPQNWTGRFLSTGNGGTGGCIQYEDMAYTAALGFSTVGTNNGHNGTRGTSFYQNLDVIEDFAYRAMHTGVVVGKQISSAFYAAEHTKSYYLGCSTGGRQGFKAAQAFPEDFDGIVAGAPAISFNNLTSWSGHFYLLTGAPGSSSFVSSDLWSVIHDDIIKQCDGIDGYVDGIIEDPRLCDYRPESLICAAGSNSSCLTGTQAETVRAIFSPLYGVNGSLVYPRMQPGSELTGASALLYSGTPFIYTVDWFRYAIYNDPSWDPATLGPADYAEAAAKNLFNIETWEGDLSAVKDRGTKILHYHGLQDGIISSENSPRYYDHVARTMNLPTSALDDFYRFFRISGMGHCGGGPGATFIGNQMASNATLDPDGNVLMAMVRWVEEGIAPETVTGTAYVNGTKDSGQVAFTRRHCKYPLRNTYSGKGDPTSPDSWDCIL